MPGRKHPFFQGPFIKNDGKLTKPLAISLSYFFLPSFRSINHQNLLYREYLYIPSSWKPIFLKKEFLIFHLIKLDMFNVGRCPINVVDWKWHTIIWKMIFFTREHHNASRDLQVGNGPTPPTTRNRRLDDDISFSRPTLNLDVDAQFHVISIIWCSCLCCCRLTLLALQVL